MMELISVIIPIYGVEKYLRKCLDSVINQTYENLEIILINDGSPDNCGKICDEYASKDDRIKVIHKENGGVSSARNAGLDIATGDYISFIDPDDYIVNDMYEYAIREIKSDDYDILEYNCYNLYENGVISERGTKDGVYISYDDILYGAFTYHISLGVISKIFKKDIIESVRFDTGFRIAEDMLFFFECAKKGARLKYVSEPLYYYLIRETSVMNKPIHKGTFDMLGALEIVEKEKYNSKFKQAFDYYYLQRCINTIQQIVINDYYKEKLEEVRKKILQRKSSVFNSKPFAINGGTCCFGKSVKLYVLLLWICPKLVYKLHPWYLRVKGKIND